MDEILQESNSCLSEKLKNKKDVDSNKSTSVVLFIQLIVSIIFTIIIFSFKLIGGEIFDSVRNWYFENVNNSIIFDSQIINKPKESFDLKIPFINLQNKEKIINTSFVNEKHEIENVPIEFSIPISSPVEKGIITSKFGKRSDPISGKEKIHYGLDICSKEGEPIYAVMPGVVERSETSKSLGNFLILDHGNNVKTLYAHCKELNVCVGDNIKRGQNIALMGNTGDYSTGTHLHVEFIINDKKYDPEPFFENTYI